VTGWGWFRVRKQAVEGVKEKGMCQGEVIIHIYLPMKMEQTECSKMLAYKIQMLGNYPEKSIQHSEPGESLK